jgi:Ser/Thr protein kinase RdoA (MazF antagonist)
MVAFDDTLKGFRSQVLPWLPHSLIHGDAHAGNMLFDGDRLTALLDWEDAAVAPALLDFAMAVRQCCFDTGAFSLYAYRAFADGYRSVASLTDDERKHIRAAVRHVSSVQAVWRFFAHNVYAPRADLKDNYKEMWKLRIDRWEPPTLASPRDRRARLTR